MFEVKSMKNIFCFFLLAGCPAWAQRGGLTKEQKTLSEAQGNYELQVAEGGSVDKSCLSGALEFQPRERTLLLGGTPFAINIQAAGTRLPRLTSSCDKEIAEAVMNGNTLTYVYSVCEGPRKPVHIVRTAVFQDKQLKSYQQKTFRNGKETSVTCRFNKAPSGKSGGDWVIRTTSSENEPTLLEAPGEEAPEKIEDPEGL